MSIENEKLLNNLASLFLSYYNPDEGYFKVYKEIKRLEYKGIFVDINKVQSMAYKCQEVK